MVPARRATARRSARSDFRRPAACSGGRGGSTLLLPPGIDPIGVARAVMRTCGRASGRKRRQLSRSSSRARCSCPISGPSRAKARSGDCAHDGSAADQAADSRAVSEPRVFERRRLRRQAMSEHLFRKPARAVTLPEPALIAGLIRAPSALSPWSNYDGALERSHVVLAQMRSRVHLAGTGTGGASRAPGHPAVSAGSRRRQRLGTRLSPPAVPQRVRRRQSTGLEDPHDVRQERAGGGGTGGRGRPQASQHAWARGCVRGDRSADRGHPGDGRRRRLRRQHVQPRDAQQAAAGIGVQADSLRGALSHGFSPVSVLSGLSNVSVPGDPEWVPKNADHPEAGRRADAARGARRVEQRGGRRSPAARWIGAVLRLASDAGLDKLPDVPSLALGSGK